MAQRKTSTARKTPDNLEHWNANASVPEEFTSRAKNGSYTSWDATWAKRRATELWGPYGKEWGLRDVDVFPIVGERGSVEAYGLKAVFFCPLSSFEIINDWPFARGRHCLKSLETNTIKKALSYLGWAADLYMGKEPYEGESEEPEEPAAGKPGKNKPANWSNGQVRRIYEAETIATVDMIEAESKAQGVDPIYLFKITDAAAARRKMLEDEAMTQEAIDRFDGATGDGEKEA